MCFFFFFCILGQPIVKHIIPLTYLKEVTDILGNQKNGSVSQFMDKLFTEMTNEGSSQQVQEIWSESELHWCDLGLSQDEVDKIVNEYKIV